jgi:2'-5' RNA ligase
MENPQRIARVFFALWPDAAERAALAAWQPALQRSCGGRIMQAATLHATLVFVGDVAPRRIGDLQQAAGEVAGEPFRLVFDEARFWKHNHIVYAAPYSLPQPLTRLVQNLEKNLARHGFHFDKRAYQPHATLLRNAQWHDAPLPEMQPVVWQAKDFALMQSLQGEQGARYEVLARFGLGC